jgi:glycosyltransferase involved in cell wall biosynthesis
MALDERAPRPARVLHVLKYYRPTFTGEGVFLERSSAVMQEIAPAVEHELLVTHTPRPAAEAEGAACSTLSRVSYLSDRPLGAAARHLALVWWFLRNLRRFDTVHVRTHADWYFLTYLIARLARRRLVLSATLDDSLPVLIRQYRPQLRALAARGFALFDAYVGISPKLQAETRSVAADPARCHLIPCGVTVPPQTAEVRARMRARLGVAEHDPVLLFVGGLCERKDPLFLVQALPRLLGRHPGLKLVLVGPPLEPDYVREMERVAARDGTTGAVVFAGEQLDPHPWFAAADALVFASRLEGFGTVVPEAMAHGIPVAVRRLPGVNDDFVLEGKNGFLFDDEAGFVAAVEKLARDPALRRQLGAFGQSLARERFGMRGIAARYLGVYGLADRIQAAPAETPDAETGLACAASVHDTRFHAPVAPPEGQPLLVTMVDAEEAFDWSRPFSRQAIDVTSMRSQHLAHRIFSRHGAVPVYLVDYAVASQEAGAAPLRELLADGLCEIGAQMHPWVTPPFVEEVNEHNSYVGNLPAALELEKARRLTSILGEAFGTAPLIYRSGRFGAGRRTADILKRLGYAADSSMAPCWPPESGNEQVRTGAFTFSPRPSWIDRERSLMEIPISAALVGGLAGPVGTRLAPFVFDPRLKHSFIPGALSRLGLLERIRLSPEGITLEEAKRLTRHMYAAGHRVFVLTYHSPSLEPGNTPYVRSAEDVQRFLGWLDAYYAFFREEIGGRCASWREVRYGAGVRPAASAAPMPATAS